MKRNIYIIYMLVCIPCFGFWAGCESPPDHCANWWYYWKDGMVVDDMDKVKYLWNPQDQLGVSSPHKTQNLVGVSDLALDPIPPGPGIPLIVTNKYDTSKQVTIVDVRDGGIDGVAEVIAHEFQHVWVYQQWGAEIGQTGMIDGRMHSDGDAIPDSVETDTTPNSIGDTYGFNPNDADSYDLENVTPEWKIYQYYGDNEVLARVEGLTNPRTTYPDKDWSKGGKQWRQ